MKKKTIALLLACVMALGVAVGGSLAWLTDETEDVVNTFTVGDINIDLKEHDYLPDSKKLDPDTTVTSESDYLFVPGDTLPKDPFVIVEENSEACYLFVKVKESGNTRMDLNGKIINWSVRDGWTEYVPEAAVANTAYYYREVDAETAKDGESWEILADNIITVNEEVTKDMVTGINSNKPTLTFTAAAVQKAHIDTVEDAWAELPDGF